MEKNQQNRVPDVKDIVSKVQKKKVQPVRITFGDRLDRIVVHKIWGVLIFAFLMFGVFTISQEWVGPMLSDLLNMGMELIGAWVDSLLSEMGTSIFFKGLILDGIIGGLAAVLGFLPLIMVLFFLLQLLEDTGYMARVALVMDRYFKKIGLAGKSIIPMYVGTACSVPAIMSARTIKNKQQRMMTILLTPFVPCGAKLPVIALFVSVFFAEQPYVTALTYLLAIAIIFVAGYIIKSLFGSQFAPKEDMFLIVELPKYKLPSLKLAFTTMLDRGWAFIKNAGTIILLMNTLVWFASNFDFSLQMVDDPSLSVLRFVSEPIAWILIPLGFGVWSLAAAAVAGFVAKEEVVGALAVMLAFSVGGEFEVVDIEATRAIMMSAGGLTAVSAFAYMAFNLFTPPCFASIGAMNVELGSKKLTVFAVSLQFIIGYLIALVIYQLGTLIFYHQFGHGFYESILIFGSFIVIFLILKNLAKKGKGLAKWVI